MNEKTELQNIPAEKFAFAHAGDRIHDKKFDDKPIGAFKDALLRFRKSRAAVVASIIIILIILFSVFAPLFITTHDSTFLCTRYAMKPARVTWLRDSLGILDGGKDSEVSEGQLITLASIGMAASENNGIGVTYKESFDTYYQPIMKVKEPYLTKNNKKQDVYVYPVRVDEYLKVGFVDRSIEQSELANIQAWEEKTGLQILFPLIEENEYNKDFSNPNYWYKNDPSKPIGNPIRVNEDGTTTAIKLSDDMTLEDNYKRNADGSLVYYEYTGGGTVDTAQYKIRVLYYNYYQYLYGFEPNYIMGTESQGYDMALRIADGIRLSLLIACFVCLVNFVIGAIYGAVEGYYGGVVDLTLERISDILSGVPFIVVATLFQIHLAVKVGPIVCLLFAYIVTGWIGTAYSVRTQFYRFKNQEYVMAARTLGAKDRRIIWKHIFPNTLGTIITSSALAIPSTIMSESMLSYLGIVNLGGANGTSLGTLLSDAQDKWIQFPHLMLYPALIISLLMICFNLFGNGLRDAFNPSLRGVED